MAIRHDLYLHEEMLLLALHDEKGTLDGASMYTYAIAGAMIAELLVRRRIELVPKGKKRMVSLVDAKPIGEPLLDDAIARMAKAKRAGSLETWIGRLAANSKMRDIIADRLCRRGILRPDERKILLVFRARIFPALDPAPEAAIVERLRRAIFTDADDIDDRTLVLLSLAKAANLLRLTFDRKELKARKDRIESLVQDDALGRAVHDAIEAVHVAMIVASTVT
jgi:hypothetical protein